MVRSEGAPYDSDMRMSVGVLAALLLLSVGCVEDRTLVQPPDVNCPECGPPGGGDGDGDGDGGQGVGGSGAQSSVVGTVVVLATPSFDQIVGYDGAATVVALDSKLSRLADDPVSGGADGTFQLDEIPGGPFWLFVDDDTNGATGVFSTYTRQIAPASAVAAPVVDVAVLTSIGQGLLPPVLPSADDAQVFVELVRNGAALPNVQVVNAQSAEVVAFDNGPSDFSTGFDTTGSFGRILILNLAASGQRLFTLQLIDDTGASFSVEMPIASGAATVVGFEI